MIIGKVMDYEFFEISKIPKAFATYKVDGETLFLCRGTYNKDFIGGNLISDKSYYYAVKIEVSGEIVYIYDEDTFLISFNENGEVVDRVRYIAEEFNLRYTRDLREMNLWQLVFVLDLDSIEGRKVLVRNFLQYNRDGNNKILDEFMKSTKIRDTEFCIVEDGYTEESVQLENVVGLTHPRYEGCSWIDAFYNLKRTSTIVQSLLDKNYYNDISSGRVEAKGISFLNIDGEYYVSSGAHRVTIAKLKGIESIYAPVSYYKTSTFHKEYYEKLLSLGFNVRLCGDENTYYNILTNCDYKYDWEVFEVSLNNESILLFNEEMIYKFYITFKNLDISDKSVKFRQYLIGFKKVYSVLIAKKYYDSKDEWYDNYVESAVEKFFADNNKLITEHKKNLNSEI